MQKIYDEIKKGDQLLDNNTDFDVYGEEFKKIRENSESWFDAFSAVFSLGVARGYTMAKREKQ